MVHTALDSFDKRVLPFLDGKNTSVVCHSSSIDSHYNHIIDILHHHPSVNLKSVFGPQHGLFGQTQDNMIEWEGYTHPEYRVPVYSLYGKHRRPTNDMLEDTGVLIIDLQDVGCRPYTYAWTMKNCMAACADLNISVLVIDRPNPLGGIKRDGNILKKPYYTFVGGAEIPLCHGMTIGEIAEWINDREEINCDLEVLRMDGWQRTMTWNDTGLPWVLPSPNMPSVSTAFVYPGMVMVEALNISEGRGTTLPFELFGAPFLKTDDIIKELEKLDMPGCTFRKHNFIPTFHKFSGEYCEGMQIHVTDFKNFEPVFTAASVFNIIYRMGDLSFNDPPYEYEENLLPFDILSGDSSLSEAIKSGHGISEVKEIWQSEILSFEKEFEAYKLY